MISMSPAPLMTLAQVQQLLPAAKLVNDADQSIEIHRITSDSRQVQAGDLFIALKGEKFDAHDFLKDVQAKGAVAALVSSTEKLPETLPGICVANTLQGLQGLAKAWRVDCGANQLKHVAVVTGSNGKTTVKGMVASIFSAAVGDAHALATQGNFNNDIGLPLTLLRLNQNHQLAVIELGMNHPGETKQLAEIAGADIALINNAQREHQEFMVNVDAVAKEHALAIQALPADGVAIFPADSEYTDYWRMVAGSRRIIDFSWGQVDSKAAVIGSWKNEAAHQVEIKTPQGDFSFVLNILGEHNAKNALAATAVAIAAGISNELIQLGLESFQPVSGRMQQHRLNQNTMVIDDSYNANPDSVRAAIDVLSSAKTSAWLVLGDMGEVGEKGPQFHSEVGAYAGEKGIQKLFATGELSKAAVSAYLSKATSGSAKHFEQVSDLCADVKLALAKRPFSEATTVLVKGSRFMRMEQVVKFLTEEMH